MMSVEMICRWRMQFLNGRTDVSDEKQGGRSSEINANAINTVHFWIKEEHCWTVDEIERYF